MSQTQDEIKQIEVEIEDLKDSVKVMEALQRLQANKDFQLIVDKGYFNDEAARMCLLRDDPALPESIRTFLEKDMAGPGAFKRYLSTINQLGMAAEDNLLTAGETLDELRADYAGGAGSTVIEGDSE